MAVYPASTDSRRLSTRQRNVESREVLPRFDRHELRLPGDGHTWKVRARISGHILRRDAVNEGANDVLTRFQKVQTKHAAIVGESIWNGGGDQLASSPSISDVQRLHARAHHRESIFVEYPPVDGSESSQRNLNAISGLGGRQVDCGAVSRDRQISTLGHQQTKSARCQFAE